jgi:hypothetical protein
MLQVPLYFTQRIVVTSVLRTVKEEMNILHTLTRRKANWIGHILRRKCLLKHIIEGKEEGMGDENEDVNSYWMTFSNQKTLQTERRRTRSHSLENAFWKKL